jgi:hypothetical protein
MCVLDDQSGPSIYDREITDVFAVQDEITQQIVGMLIVGLEEDTFHRAKRKQPHSLIADEHWLRGKRVLWTTGQNNLSVRRNFEDAAKAGPNFLSRILRPCLNLSNGGTRFPECVRGDRGF